MQDADTRLDNYCFFKELAAQKFIQLIPLTSNVDMWAQAVLATTKKSKFIEVDFSANFHARFVEFLGFVSEILGQHKIKEDSIKYITPLFLFYFAPEDARRHVRSLPKFADSGKDSDSALPDYKTSRYLEFRAREIVVLLQSLKGVLFKKTGLVTLAYLHSCVQVFYSTCIFSTFKAQVQIELVWEAEKLARETLGNLHDISTGRKVVTTVRDGNVVALALSKACMKVLNVVCCLLNRDTVTEVQSHLIFLGVLRCHGITTGRIFYEGTQLGDYEDQTAARLSRIFVDICSMINDDVFTSTVLPTECALFNRCIVNDFPNASRLVRIERMFLYQLADSVEFYLGCLRIANPDLTVLVIKYQKFKPDPWDLTDSYDKRVFLDLVMPLSQTLAFSAQAQGQAEQDFSQRTSSAPETVSDWDMEAFDVETI